MSQQTEQHGARGIPTRAVAVQVLEGADAGQRASGDARLTVGTASDNDLVLQDPTVSRYHLELRRGPHGIEARDLGSTNGTLAGALRLTEAAVPAGTVLTLGKTALRVDDGEAQELDLHDGTHLAGLRGRSPAMRHLMAKVKRASQSDVAVLLVGESGTGKERIAEALHQIGPRRRGPFVTVDCGALAPTLVASELFGHEAGAFTGAKARHPGAFERAD
ncbi:MAG TPA: sigma 54-interacting transcriptional regulator, partial [Polyangiaceae bacterium LLY-WYZ-15_(1-7)]|nr:sigma 54-interacting transcriptional regulator [Polyangiaceae bacterium LLY-WYZ-15_(1-7)]